MTIPAACSVERQRPRDTKRDEERLSRFSRNARGRRHIRRGDGARKDLVHRNLHRRAVLRDRHRDYAPDGELRPCGVGALKSGVISSPDVVFPFIVTDQVISEIALFSKSRFSKSAFS